MLLRRGVKSVARRKNDLASETGTRYYGDGTTIHRTGHLHVETFMGTVVAVWFRCQMLPFQQAVVDGPRATAMEKCLGMHGGKYCLPTLTGVEVTTREDD